MDKEILVTIFGIIAGLAGTIRWVLGFYFKKEAELESVRNDRTQSALKTLDESIKDHNTTITIHSQKMDVLEEKIEQAIVRYRDFQDANKRVQESLRAYVESSEQRVVSLEGKVIQLGEDLFMIKSKNARS